MKLFILLLCVILKLAVGNTAETGLARKNEFLKKNTKASHAILTKSTEVAALGRVADLGDLYDARNDNFAEISLYKTDLSGDAIHSIDNAFSSIDYVRTESFSEKMEKLGVQAGLSVSFLGGMVSVSGSGKYLSEDKKSSKSAKTSLIYSIRTVRDDLKVFSNSSRSLIDLFLLENIDATHVVVGIEWGANVVLSLEETNTDSSNVQEIQGELEAALNLAVLSVSGSASVDFGSSDVEKSSSFSLHLNGDIIPNTVPQTINESISFIRDIPNLIKNENGGKGKIMKFILMPLPTVKKVLLPESNQSDIIKEIQQELIDQFMQIFQQMKDSELQINDVYDSFNTWSLMVPESEFLDISEVKSNFDSFTNKLRLNFSDLIVQFRNNELNEEALYGLISSYDNSNWTSASINQYLDKFTPTMHKIRLLDLFQSFNSMFVDRRTDMYKILTDNYQKEVRVILVDLSMDVSSHYVHDIIRLLQVELGKEASEAVSYYIQDAADTLVPTVQVYSEGKIIKSFAADKTEYVLLTDMGGHVVIIDTESYEVVTSYVLRDISNSIVAVVNDTIYNIDTLNGIISSGNIEDVMTQQGALNWTQVGSFPSERSLIRNSAAVRDTLIYFVTSSGVVYQYDTLSKTVMRLTNITTPANKAYASLLEFNNTLYIHMHDHLYAIDRNNPNYAFEITKSEVRTDCGLFEFQNTICRIGGNTTDIYPDPVSCYDPNVKNWAEFSFINEARRYPGVAATKFGTYIFGGLSYPLSGASNWIKSVELLDHGKKVWTYAPTPLAGAPQYVQAVVFDF